MMFIFRDEAVQHHFENSDMGICRIVLKWEENSEVHLDIGDTESQKVSMV